MRALVQHVMYVNQLVNSLSARERSPNIEKGETLHLFVKCSCGVGLGGGELAKSERTRWAQFVQIHVPEIR
jgi:hypothetical protein